MSVKISKISAKRALNCKIHPVLYKFYLRLHDTMGAEIVHRRKRASNMCIEIIFCSERLACFISGKINTLPEAEECGFRIICRPQMKKGHTVYKGHRVYQLFLTPVHPKKRRAVQPQIASLASFTASDATARA